MKYKEFPVRLLQPREEAYFMDCRNELYATIEQDRSFAVKREVVKAGLLKERIVWVLSKVPFLLSLKSSSRKDGQVNFASMIGGDFKLLIPYAFHSRNNYIYMYDVWPKFQGWLFPMLDFFNIRYVFFSSRQVQQDYERKRPGGRCKSMWLPEALDASVYHFKDYNNKHIDVLEFGRIYQQHHDLIREALAAAGKKHVYRTASVPILFPDKSAFIEGLANARIVICVPSDITHPERAEYISTMTLRYLQAMASKCLILGVIPSDMEEVFGYLPIVEIDMDNAASQVIEILENYGTYIPLIERNYKEVHQKHQWKNRWEVIREKMMKTL